MEPHREWWDQAPRRSARRAPLLALTAAFAIMGAGLYAGLRSFAQPEREAPPASSTPAQPPLLRDPTTLAPIALASPTPEADRVFSSQLTDFAVALDHLTKAGTEANGEELARAEAALTSPDVAQALGAPAAAAFVELTSAAKTAARALGEDEPSATALDVATARLDEALLPDGLPYFVDANVIFNKETGARIVLLYGFSVASTDVYTSGDSKVRAVRVRRLDHLNWSYTLLGFVNLHRAQAMVLLDQIEEELVEQVLPALAEGAPMPMLAPGAASTSDDGKAIEAQGGKDLRADIVDVPDLDQARARELGEALRARRALFVKWDEQGKARGITMRFPARLTLDVGTLERQWAGVVPWAELKELRRLQERLARPEVLRAYEVFRDSFIASIERHEVQHRLDQIRPIPMLERIDSIVPKGRGPANERIRDKIRIETSAYLAQIARDDRLARSTFARLLQFVVNPAMRGTPESYATLIILEALGPELKVEGGAPLFHDHAFDLGRIARAHQRIVAVPREELRAAAARAWSRLFGMDLAPLAGPLNE